MNNIDELKALINANIKRNGRQAITGNVLNGILNAMVDNLGDSIFLATYGTTTLAEIREADAEGMIVFCKNGNDILRLQSVNVNGARFAAIVVYEGKYAICNNNGWSTGTFSVSEVFFATYGVTTWDEILLMAQTRIVCCVYQNRMYLLSNPVDISDPVTLVFTNIDGTTLKTLNVTIAGAWSNSSIELQVLIANDLTTNDPTKALSAAQGVALKALIDALGTVVAGKASQADLNALQQQVNTKASQTDLDATNAEVSQLGQKVTGGDIPIPFSFGNTLIWYATESGHQGGATATSGGYKSTDFVDVSTIDSISFIIQQPTGTVAGVAFYDSNKVFISALNGYWRDRPEETIQKSNFPNGTAYIRICTYYESYYESSLYANKSTTGLEGDVAALAGRVQTDEEKYNSQIEDIGINSIYIQFPASSFVLGSLSNGTLVSNNTRVASDKIWTFQSEVRLIAQPNFRFGIHSFVNGVFSADSGWQVAYTIPAGTSFKIVISRTPEGAISEGDIPTFLDGVKFNGGYCIDRKNGETIRGLQELSEESIDFRFDYTLIWYETASGHQGGTTATSGGYKSTDFIPVSKIGGFVFVIQQPTGTVAGIAFYDSNKTFISALNGYYRDRGEEIINKLDFPANTTYVRFCTYYEASYESSLYLKARNYESVWDAFYGLDSRVSTLEEGETVPQDKYWAACGDSITNANHGNIFDIDETDPYLPIDGYEEVSTYKRKNYAYYIAKNYRIKWANYGYGGTTLTHTAPKAYQGQEFAPFVDTRITQLKDGIDWDYITIFFGYNDAEFNPIYQRDLWLSETYGGDIGYPAQSSQIGASGFATQAQKDACDAITGYVGDIEYTDNELYFFAKFIGTLSDNTKNTWCGALNYAIPYLLNKYRRVKIVLVVPFINGTEKTRMIRTATLAVAAKFGLQVFDFGEVPYWYMTAPLNGTIFRNPDDENGYWYAESGIAFNPNIDGYNRAKYSYDGLHPSNLGYQTIAGPIGYKLING